MRNILTLLILISFSAAIFGLNVTLKWDANSEPDIAGYKVYYKPNSSGQPSGDYNVMIDVKNVTSKTVEGLDDSKIYYFAVTAYDTSGLESDFSNEVDTRDISVEELVSVTGLTSEGEGINKSVGPYEYKGFSGVTSKFSWLRAAGATKYQFKLVNISNLTTVVNGETGDYGVEIILPKVGVYELFVKSCKGDECKDWSRSTNPSVSLVNGSKRAWVIRAKISPPGKPSFN
jgi:hypothetical protein